MSWDISVRRGTTQKRAVARDRFTAQDFAENAIRAIAPRLADDEAQQVDAALDTAITAAGTVGGTLTIAEHGVTVAWEPRAGEGRAAA